VAQRCGVRSVRMKLFTVILVAMIGIGASAAPVRDGPVVAELIADTLTVTPGQPFTIALRMQVDSPWHIYWINPGDSGLAPSLDWTLPEGLAVGDMQHPPPLAIPTPPFMTYGHTGDVVFLMEVRPPADLSGPTVTLSAEVDWLVCHELCIPGFAEVELSLPVRAEPGEPSEHAEIIAAARSQRPIEGVDWALTAQVQADRLILAASPPTDDALPIDSAQFFPYSRTVIRHAAPQTWHAGGGGGRLELVVRDAAEPPEYLSGVLVVQRGGTSLALRVNIPVAGTFSSRPANPKGT